MLAPKMENFCWKDLRVSCHGSRSSLLCMVFIPIVTGKFRQDNLIVTGGREAEHHSEAP